MESTYLHLAVGNGRINFAQELIKRRADVNAPNKELSTPLHVAILHQQDACVRLLIENGADLTATDKVRKAHTCVSLCLIHIHRCQEQTIIAPFHCIN